MGYLAILCANDPVWAYIAHKYKPPRMTSGGNARAVFLGYAGSRQLGFSFDASQPMTLGLSGFGGESIRYQPMVGWKKIGTPFDVKAFKPIFEVWEVPPRRSRTHSLAWSISSSSPKFSALSSALC